MSNSIRAVWKNCFDYAPFRSIGIVNSLKKKIERTNDNVLFDSRIPLLFTVQTQIESKFNFHFKAIGTKHVYVKPKTMDKAYTIVHEKDDFK